MDFHLPETSTIERTFRTAASRYGGEIAVQCGDEFLSYEALDRQSDALADCLIENGVQEGDPVGIACERRPELIIGLLGILKAGGCYLPLDPSYPVSTRRFLAEDSGIRFLLGEDKALDDLLIETLSFEDFPITRTDREETSSLDLRSDDPAYLLYTSGTTGQPKGVLVPHRAVLRLVIGNDFSDLGPETRALQHSPVAFDASTFEIWGPLLNGGRLVLFPEEALTLRSLGEALERFEINTLWLTAGLFHAMVDERIEDLRGLDQLLAGGDILSPSRARKLLTRYPDLHLINGYGPTENTTFTCCHRITLDEVQTDSPIPIGKPIAGTKVFLLDKDLEPVEGGGSGELCASGFGLALGYWNREEQTRERFVPAPWDETLLLYRTGDRARKDDDGVIHFEGREDQQVKIRGFRIELTSIEEALESHAQIDQAVVLAEPRPDQTDKILRAFVVGNSLPSQDEIRQSLAESLPEHEIPPFVHEVSEIPLTANGKIDRAALLASIADAQDPSPSPGNPSDDLVASLVSEVLGLALPPVDANFFDLGMSSLEVVRLHERLEQSLDREIPVTDLFEHTTIDSLSRHLHRVDQPVKVTEESPRERRGSAIAIVGMAGRFPGAPDVDTFWKNLLEGRETITHFTEEELEYSNASNDPDNPYVRSRGIVEGSDLFDAKHFGIPPRDAELLDPQHRLLLECAQETLENAGHDPDRFPGKIGFFSGSSQNSYLLNNLCADREFAQKLAAGYPVNDFGILFGNDKDFLPTRIAYKLNLKGPAMAIQCACSTSLIAVTQACESLRSGTCDMALAGGISLTFPQKRDYLYTPEGMASGDGHCRSFDAAASGTVFGEGVGLVALRLLDDALADGDEIIAVIKGFAQNNDGAAKAGYASPSISGQVDMIVEAQQNAGVTAESVGYVEAHGTGTPLGDPIEVAALSEAFSRSTDETGFCGLGTAKTNVGHLDIAAGVTGLIKAALTVKHGQIPPLVHFEKPNPKINFEGSAFFPVTETTDWNPSKHPRRAGVSALGVGGTNVHVILEEAPEIQIKSSGESGPCFFPLSASSPEALQAAIERLGEFSENTSFSLADIAFTLQEGRREFDHRACLAAQSREDLAQKCREHSGKGTKQNPRFEQLAFLFPGQGAQHPGMARELYENEPIFREIIDQCSSLLEREIGIRLVDLICPAPEQVEEMATLLRDTSLAQPAIFSVSYALAKLWQHWGIEPDILVGHSIGEFAAACFAGVISLEEALPLIAARGKLMSALPGGVMISVRATRDEVAPFLGGDYDLAAVNGEKALVLAGPVDGAEELERSLSEAGLIAKRLHTSHAFHSRMMDPIVEDFEKAACEVALHPPQRRIFSTVHVDWLSDDDATDPTYWAAHLRKPVLFHDAIATLWGDSSLGFLEVGPGNTLATLAKQNPDRRNAVCSLSSLPHPSQKDSSYDFILETVGALWSHGWKLDWAQVEGRDEEPRRRVPLPTYPFQRQRFWVDPVPAGTSTRTASPEVEVEPLEEATTVETSSEERDFEKELQEVFAELSGLNPGDIAPSATFLELGLDSLLLTQASRELEDHFGVKITLRELIDAFSSVEALVAHLETSSASPAKKANPVATLSLPQTKEVSSAPALKLDTKKAGDLTPQQRRHIEDLVSRYTKKTAKSKALTAKHRKAHADPRTASGFNREWKEMVYQIVTRKSKGSRLLDVDGNEYIDILNGFGPGFLGHSPDFLLEAIEEQLHQGFEVGPNQEVAMEAAELFCEVTGNERTSFVCTGSEAVQASMRLARTVTGRDKVVIFARDYHGNFDEVLVRGVNNQNGLKSLPVAPGIPKRAAEDMIVLPYGTEESLEIIRQLAGDLAAVIVEPVQSRRPEFRPHAFIREVREITRNSGTLFVFDEVVTGFRFGPGGAQDYYGIDADLATYGKVVGGGMPVGVVSGKAEFMDTFDGGDWSYGDDSFPEKPVTFFAGTFVRHPLAMASLKAMLTFFRDQPLHFWQALNAKGDRLAGTIHRFFQDHHLPYELPNCGSLMYARVGEDQPHGNLLFYHLRERGVFLLEGFPSYLTASHTEEDLEYVIDAFRDSAQELQEAGFFPESEPIATAPPSHVGSPPRFLSEGASPPTAPALHSFAVPTTQPQREIVVASALNPGASCAFNESASLHLTGELNEEALQFAIRQLTDRHDALRSTFSEDGTSMLVHRNLAIDFQPADSLEETLREQADTPFDLATGPLMRMRLIREGNEHILVMTAHHAIVDGWSYNVIAEELSASYNAFVQPESAPERIPDAKQYAEHAREQGLFEASEAYAKQKEFWLEQFSEIPAPIELPLDRPYPTERTFSGDTVEHEIDRATYEAIKKVGAQQGSTLYATLSSVFALLLHRLCGQEELVYCIPAAGQNDGENNANLVGHCVHFLPLRSKLTGDDTWVNFLGRNRQTFLEATDHRSYTYGELIRDLKIARDPRRMPLSEIAFNVERMDYFGEWSGLECGFVPNPKSHVHYTMFMNVVESGHGLQICVDYNGDVLDRSTVEGWTCQFETLIRSLIMAAEEKNHDLPAQSISLFSESERRELLEEWSGANRLPIETKTVPELFAESVQAFPSHSSLKTSDQQLTYTELDRYATQAAAQLQTLGVSPGDRVALMLDRSVDLIVSLLGILKAGAAYVPIDPSYPESRIEWMLEDSGARLLITDQTAPQTVETQWQPDYYREGDASTFTPVAVDGEDLAYVIYTSGSTGKPKGTLIPHRGISRLVSDTDYISFGEDEVFLLSSPISFDASTLELWGSLLNGASLALLPPGTPSLNDLEEAIRDHKVTTLWLTSGLFQLMVEEKVESLRPLRQLLVGGDVVSIPHARRALEVLGETGRLYNGYGPTENTTFTTTHHICLSDTEKTSLPIGKPIRGTTVYILDEQMNPVPKGVRGRLYFGGEGLSLGYLNQEALTHKAFVENPFADDSQARLYDSGDQGRWLRDGTIEFLGRADEQVKIRGFRIETGEIESILNEHPEVTGAAIVVTGETAQDKQLNAFLLSRPDQELNPKSVLHHAQARLPGYMIPNRVIARPEFPLTANGKIDYRALREEAQRIAPERSPEMKSEPPHTKTEEAVAALWSEILNVESIGRNDDFFSLGGHSLAGLRVFAKLQDQLHINLPLATLFQASTVKELSARIDETLASGESTRVNTNLLTLIRPGDPDEIPLFLVHGGDGGTLFYKKFAEDLDFSGEIYTIEAPILIDRNYTIEDSDLAWMAAHYLGQIRGRFPNRSFHLGGYSFGGVVAYEMAVQSAESNNPVEKLLLFDTPNPAREHEFQRSLSGRLLTDWHSQRERSLTGQAQRFGTRLLKGVLSKMEYLSHTRELKKQTGEVLQLPEHLKILRIQENHRKLASHWEPSPYEGATYLFRAAEQSGRFQFDQTMGWNGLLSHLEVHEVSGHHEIIFQDPQVESIRSACSEILKESPLILAS